MTPAEVHALAVAHGLTVEQAVVATAIAWAESGLRPDAVGDIDLEDNTWGPSVGLFQIRSLRLHTGTGKERDVERLTDPSFNTRSMVAISAGGTNWAPWSVYKNGRYRQHLDAVRAAIESGGSAMKFVSRSEWGARRPKGQTPAPGMTRGIGVHWLGGGQGPTDHDECAAKMREIQDFHMGPQRGWADFAYNAGVCCHGYVFEGRGPGVRNAANGGGTHQGYDANAGWFAIIYLNGTDGPDLTPEGMDGINDAAEWSGAGGGNWLGHGDFLSTECPGDETYGWVHAGHPRGTTAPSPNPQPEPQPEMEEASMFIFDASPARGGGIYYTNGRTKWGVPNGAALVFYASGKVPHLGVLDDQVYDALPWDVSGSESQASGLTFDADPPDVLAGPLDEAMERSEFETGDPGCQG